jgi:hypothetical protein
MNKIRVNQSCKMKKLLDCFNHSKIFLPPLILYLSKTCDLNEHNISNNWPNRIIISQETITHINNTTPTTHLHKLVTITQDTPRQT